MSATPDRPRRVRSPSFPFIPLGKAIARARSIAERYERHPVSLAAAGEIWGYAPKSSGLLQTHAALRACGLMEDIGVRPEDRRIRLRDLGWRILHDTKADDRQEAIREAAMRPPLIAEYASKWLPIRPSDDECIRELHLNRGFRPQAAKQYLSMFDQTTALANLASPDRLSHLSGQSEQPWLRGVPVKLVVPAAGATPTLPAPGSRAMQISVFGNRLEATAMLLDQEDVAKFIAAIEATKTLLPAKNQAGKDELNSL
jgi:hypothetical protein